MTGRAAFIWDDELRHYDFGPGHPLAPVRVQLAYRLIRDFKLLDNDDVDLLAPAPSADVVDLLRVHDPAFITAVMAASADPGAADPSFGLGTEDVPAFAGMHDASRHVCGATMTAAAAIADGGYDHAVNVAGGLHHSGPRAASGFCVYNDIGVAISWLLEQGYERIAYVDVDAHHGDGVQAIFWDEPRVMTISLHETGRTLFPGSGFPEETGGPGALGASVNVALPPGIGDVEWLRAFEAVVPEVLEAFNPQILVTQQGCDSHTEDPLAHLALTIDGQRRTYELLHEFAHRYADGKWLAVGGGGYEWLEVVPRAWTHLSAIAFGTPIPNDTEVPEAYVEFVHRALGRPTPGRMTDGRTIPEVCWDARLNPEDPVDRAILATRRAIFPLLGIDLDDWHGM